MDLRYTRRALVKIDRALAYIEARSPQGAVHVRDRILTLVTLLHEQPRAGRPTSRPGVRRLSATPYPYLIDYRVTPTEIIIMRFRHAARRPIR
ncbi:type II toxin-antitoxin system RelE/ParE family toxin [Bradyrhizobium sp. BEA-2-5]|uniref:type II toxin-antitoxin system RelE/ParE family toxin n=1 Tax=Bradyrhizobium TaxID=374 RepID=UPI0009E346B6|nr:MULTISPECIES: type II toxin-antitoxin system RelE/ParE family toxin [Bradyrhizobium]WOH79269.1 type II toxin-antitoxin system RelE/ParE family toxin [Bradyrhizobium sp. BEA-2-5]